MVDLDAEMYQGSCVSTCVDFCVALAQDQGRCNLKGPIEVYVLVMAGPDMESEEEWDELSEEENDDLSPMKMAFVEFVEEAWEHAYASLENAKACEVALTVGRYN